MCGEEPETAGNVIQDIIVTDQSDQFLANTGAGPFEDLMSAQEVQAIEGFNIERRRARSAPGDDC